MTHTPGPWSDDYFDRVDSKDGQICILNKGMRTGSCAANARLIAAAPDLLNMVKWFVEMFEPIQKPNTDGYNWLENCRALIAKIEGEL